jgi:GNAT superfamily N-acetyltransferase
VEAITFRSAGVADSASIADLVTQLGYPTTAAEMEQRLRRMLAHPDYVMIVAESSGELIALVGAYIGLAIEFDEPYGRLTGLVVRDRWRGLGVGKQLMEHIEALLRERGATMITLTSGNHRTDAHRFYRNLAYDATGVRFVKSL